MANYVVSDASLSAVADAIRAKGGTSAQLAFPAEFVQAIEDIPTGGGGLPDGYQAVEWIGTDGASRIDTGVAFDETKDFVLEVIAMFYSSETQGAVNIGWNAGGTFGAAYNKGWWWYDGAISPSAANALAADGYPTKIVMTIEAGATTNTVTEYSNFHGSKTLTRAHPNVHLRTMNYPLFATIGTNNFNYTPTGIMIRSVVIKQGNKTIRDMDACYRISDGTIGFFDKINDVFYTNQGTGVFTKGYDLLTEQQALNILMGGESA